jgi:cytochrome c biogenesis protein CcdA
MLRLAGLALSIGLADSLNPTTVGPALYLATVRKAVLQVTLFMVGVLTVNMLGGLVLTFGPGRLLIGLIPHPQRTTRHVIQIVAGVIVLGFAAALWFGRRRLARKQLPMQNSSGGGSALIAGATIAAFELPTAVPYFAVIAAIVASRATVLQEILLLLIYNVAFVVPMLAIVVVLLVGGEKADRVIKAGGAWLQRRWPVVLACLLLVVGSVLIILGGTGLVRG